MKQILFGVGNAVLKDYTDPTKILALTKLKDVAIYFSGEEEPITGGDGILPIAYFPRDKAIQVTATNALFDIKMLEATQGTESATGSVAMTEFIDVEIPADGIVQLDYIPNDGTVAIDGFEEVDITPTAGKFQVVDDTLVFAVADAGKAVVGVYERPSSTSATTVSGKLDVFAKPFVFIHRIPIYDENTTIVAQGQLTVYKAKSDSSFEFNYQSKTAYAPRLVLNALDAKRSDKKLWDFTIDPV